MVEGCLLVFWNSIRRSRSRSSSMIMGVEVFTNGIFSTV